MFLIGFFMGTIFPGAIGWGTVEFGNLAVIVSGFLMAANQIGTGIATNVLGNYEDHISMIFRYLTIVCVFVFICFQMLKKDSKIDEAF